MSEVEQSGRTVLFVSHNMDAMARLCPHVIWLDKGTIRATGPTAEVIAEYTRTSAAPASTVLVRARSVGSGPDHRGRARRRARRAPVRAQHVVARVDPDRRRRQRARTWPRRLRPGDDEDGRQPAQRGAERHRPGLATFAPGRHRWRCPVPPIFTPGEYVVGVWLGTNYETMQFEESVLTFTIDGDDAGRPTRLLRLGNPVGARTSRRIRPEPDVDG